MTHPTGESESDALRFDFDRRLMLHALGLYHHCNNRRTGRRALVLPITQPLGQKSRLSNIS
jgi:hypothetical protein